MSGRSAGGARPDLPTDLEVGSADQDGEARLEGLGRILHFLMESETLDARTHARLARLRPEHRGPLEAFAAEAQERRAAVISAAAEAGVVCPDKRTPPLEETVDRWYASEAFDALLLLRALVVGSMRLAVVDAVGDAAPTSRLRAYLESSRSGTRSSADWTTRYVRLVFFRTEEALLERARSASAEGIRLLAPDLDTLSRSFVAWGRGDVDCAGALISIYTRLLSGFGIEEGRAVSSVMALFVPLLRQQREAEDESG